MGGFFSHPQESTYEIDYFRPYFHDMLVKIYCEFLAMPDLVNILDANNPCSPILNGHYLKSVVIMDDHGTLCEVTYYNLASNQILDYPIWINRDGISDNVKDNAASVFRSPYTNIKARRPLAFGFGSNQWRDVLFYRISEEKIAQITAAEGSRWESWLHYINMRRQNDTLSIRSYSLDSLSSNGTNFTVTDSVLSFADADTALTWTDSCDDDEYVFV